VDTSFKQSLKAKAHHLNPVVLLGAKGLTPAVVAETDVALTAHELIKVKLNAAEKAEKLATALSLCEQVQAELVQLIGRVVVLYRKNPE